MYEWSLEFLEKQGYYQYEISNWARMDQEEGLMECRHNLQYWRNRSYLGFGAGAHGYAGRLRVADILAPAVYIRRCLETPQESRFDFPYTPATSSAKKIDRVEEMGETMMVGLRLTREGVSRQAFQRRFDLDMESVYKVEIQDLISLGLLEWFGEARDILRLTPRGRLLGNQVFMRFI
jgi:oxygen-independent coproporphyrinogen-3 oxidase